MSKAGDPGLVGGRLCLDFANIVGNYLAEPREEPLADYVDLLVWYRRLGVVDDVESRQLARAVTKHPGEAEAALGRARDLRDAIFEVFFAIANGKRPPQPAIEVVNASLVTQQLVKDGDRWALRCLADGGLDAPLRPIARSAAELLVDHELHERIRVCGNAEHNCTWLFVDESKNGMRRWCTMRDCGNRAKARRHYERTRNA